MKIVFTLLFLTVFIFSATSQVPSYVPVQDLKGWYSFDGNTADSSGSSNHLTNNGATLTTDRHGNANSAYQFDGSNDNMVKSTPSFVMGADSSFTISIWFNKANSTTNGFPFWHGLLQSQGGTGKFIYFMSCSNSGSGLKWGTNKQGSAWYWTSSTYTANTWEHLVCVYDNKSMTLYQNGSPVATNTFAHIGTITSVMPFYLGSNSNSDKWFGGKIDDVGVWTRALSASEVSTLYSGCTSVVQGPTVSMTACDSYTTAGGTTYTSTGIYTDTLKTPQGCDSVLTLNLTINNSTAGTLTDSSCVEYVSPSGNHVWTTSGTFKDTIPNSEGCDSVITVTLTIKSVNTVVISTPTALNAVAANATFQWLDCDNNFATVSGATSNLFQPTSNGNYAVEVTQGGCVDTSICYAITGIGIDEINTGSGKIFPNPSTGEIFINVENLKGQVLLEIYDISGKKVFSVEHNATELVNKPISLCHLQDGLYVVQLKSESGNHSQRLILKPIY